MRALKIRDIVHGVHGVHDKKWCIGISVHEVWMHFRWPYTAFTMSIGPLINDMFTRIGYTSGVIFHCILFKSLVINRQWIETKWNGFFLILFHIHTFDICIETVFHPPLFNCYIFEMKLFSATFCCSDLSFGQLKPIYPEHFFCIRFWFISIYHYFKWTNGFSSQEYYYQPDYYYCKLWTCAHFLFIHLCFTYH